MGPLEWLWRNSDRGKRLAEVPAELLTRVLLLDLAETAINDTDWFVRQAALSGMRDGFLKGLVALEANHADARRDAAFLLRDQSVLVNLARHDPDSGLRRWAAGWLTDRTALADVARRDPHPRVQRAALDRFDQLTGRE